MTGIQTCLQHAISSDVSNRPRQELVRIGHINYL